MTKRRQLIYFFLFIYLSTSARVVFTPDSLAIESMIDSAFRLSKAGDFIGCIDLVDKPIADLKKSILNDKSTALLGEAYLVKAEGLRRLDDFDIASTLYEEAERVLVNCPTEDCRTNLFKCYNGFGITNRRRGHFEDAIHFYEKALVTQRSLKNSPKIWQALIMNNLANCEDNIKNFEGAFSNYKKAIKIIEESGDRYQHMLAGFHGNLAESYFKVNKHDKAIHHYSKAIEFFKHNNKKRELPFWAEAQKGIGACYFVTNKKKKGFKAYNRAFEIIGFKELTNRGFDEVNLPSTAIDILINYANEHLKMYQSENDLALLLKAKKYHELAIEFLLHAKLGFREDISKEILLRENYGAFEGAIEANYLLYKLDGNIDHLKQALNFAEKSQNAFLMESVMRGKAVDFVGIPDSLLKKERKIKATISKLENELIELKKEKNPNPQTINIARQSIFKQKENYQAVLDIYEKYYPEYFELKYSSKTVSSDFIKDVLLPANTCLLEYFVGEKSVFVFLVSKEEFNVFKVDKNESFDDWVETFQKSISNYDPLDKNNQNDKFVESGFLLYQSLLLPIKDKLSESVIIVPSGELSTIPFDALVTELPDRKDFSKYKEHQYLGNQYKLSYSYSATLLKEWNRTHKTIAPKQLAVFAPSYGDDYSVRLGSRNHPIKDLKHSKEESINIAESSGGELYLAEDADVSTFQKNAKKYSILHLAMHSIADDKLGGLSFLAFSKKKGKKNNLLYLKDLFNLSLNAEMVVLSSCRSGIGSLKRGEGIVSLARGFSYAGAKSIITTLWEINDRFSAEIMTQFYGNLKKGMSKDESLQVAKKNFIKSQKDRNAHPHFWAGFIPIGNMNAVEIKQTNSFLAKKYLYLFGALLVLSLLGAFILRQKNDKSLHSG